MKRRNRTEATGDSEAFRAFQRECESEIALPCKASVIGEPVTVIGFGFDGNLRRGLTATCRRADGSVHVIGAAEVVISPTVRGARYLAAYREWVGAAPIKARKAIPRRAADSVSKDSIEMFVLSMKQSAARCRLLGSDLNVTLRASRLWTIFPGEIAVVKPLKQWRYAGHQYLAGKIESSRLDVAALGLVPLKLEELGRWRPSVHYWGEDGEPIEEWAKPIIACGPRPEYEMEQILPGPDIEDPFSDPIGQSNDLKDAGDFAGAYKILMDLCQTDLRCLDAHAHLGNLAFERRPEEAIRHYEVGFRIGELSLGSAFDGPLPWGWIDNRPFLRCMHGYGLCLWRLGRFADAAHIFDRMLWLNPSDNQGVRCLIDDVRAKAPLGAGRVATP